MDLQHRVKPLAVLLAFSVVVSLPLSRPASAQNAEGTELNSILLMEETAKPTPVDSNQMEPPVPMLDLEENMPAASNHSSSDIPVIPTKNLREILGAEQAEPVLTPVVQPNPATAGEASGTKIEGSRTTEQRSCHYTSQLHLTHNQIFQLKRWKKNFERDNKAAFDSIRIKRNLLKRLGQHPQTGRDREQSAELKQQIHQEWKALQTKREAQIAHVLSDAQYEKWRQLRQECQPQAQKPGVVFNREPEESQLKRTLRRNY